MPFPPVTPGGPPAQLTEFERAFLEAMPDFERAYLEAIREATIALGGYGAAAARTSRPPRAASPGGTGAAPSALPRVDSVRPSSPRATADRPRPSLAEPSPATPAEAPRIAIQSHENGSSEDGPRISFEVLKKIKSEEKFCTRIMKNPSPYGSQYYEQKHINKWNGRLVSEYEAHMAASKSAWLNVVPEKISIQNLALHGTNFDVALLAMKMRVQPPDGGAEHPGGAGVAGGGQLLPVGNLLKRGGTLVTGESGARLLNLRRVSTVSVSGGLNIEKVFRTAQEYAWSAAHGRVRVNNGRSSQTPIVVIGDGMDTKKLRYHSTLSPDVGLLPGSEIGGEVAYKRLNIRGLLCQESDLDYVLQVLKEEKLNVTVNTYESFREQVEQKPLLAYMGAEGTPQRRQLLEKLMGVPLPDYPDYSEADWRKSTLSEDGDDF